MLRPAPCRGPCHVGSPAPSHWRSLTFRPRGYGADGRRGRRPPLGATQPEEQRASLAYLAAYLATAAAARTDLEATWPYAAHTLAKA
eukprot:7048191-Prymnesium_polylepis.1